MQNSTVIRCENSVWLMRVIGIQTIGSLDQNDSDGSKELSLKKRHGRTDEGRREGGKDNMARRSHRHAGLADRWILADKFLTYHLHFFCSCRHFQGCPLELPSCCWSRPPPWAPAEISQLVLVRVAGLPGAPADPGCCPPWGAGFQLQLILVAGPLWGAGWGWPAVGRGCSPPLGRRFVRRFL